MNEEAKDFLKKCIEIYSPSGKEDEISKFVAEFLKKHQFIIRFDKVGNLLAEKGQGRPVLLFITHLDTIPGKLPVIEEAGKIYGRGAVDCKSSLAAMVFTISKYNFMKNGQGTVIFAGIVREEDSLIGIEELVKSDIQPDYAIFGEPTTINQICIGYKGRISVGFKVLSQTGHAASSWQYVNAIEVCIEIWNLIKGVCWQLSELYCQKNMNSKYYNKIIPTITIISGGQLTNCVPCECVLHIDIRYPPSFKSDILLTEIRKNILHFKELYEKERNIAFQIQETITSLIDGFETNSDDLIVGSLRWAIFNITNQKPKLVKKTGTTFINAIGLKYGIPSITYGPGDPKIEHTDNEFIEINEYLKSIEIYNKFLTKLFESYHKKHSNKMP